MMDGTLCVKGCGRYRQHRTGLCRTCENERTGKARQTCQGCGRMAFGALCVACRTGQTDAGRRNLAAAAPAPSAPAETPVLYERQIGRRVYEVVFDGSVR